MNNSIDEKMIKIFQASAEDEITILLMADENEFGHKLNEFSNELTRLAPRIKVKKESPGLNELPGIYLNSGFSCHFIPTGYKLKGMMEALAFSAPQRTSKPDQAYDNFATLNLPAELRLYVAEGCPHCPLVFDRLLALPFVNEHIRLLAIDPFYFPEMATKDNVRSVPTTLLDNDFRWTGSIDLKELAQVMRSRNPSMLSAGSLQLFLQEGNATGLIELFRQHREIAPAFFDLLAHPLWSTRLGAMVVMETLIESDPDLAARAEPFIWEKFNLVTDSVKGDLLYIIGELGRNANITKLNQIIQGEYNSEVKDAASEAIAKLTTEDL